MPTVPQLRAAQKSSACPRDRVSSGIPSRRVLLLHRRCAREYAAYVELHAGDRRQFLPRWHQEDRGPDREPYAHHEVAPDGAYAKIPIWTGRDHFLQVVAPLVIGDAKRRASDGILRTTRPDPADKRPGSPVSEKLLRRYLAVRSAYADQRTGRRCIVRPETLASVLGVDQASIHRCQNVARSLGLERVVAMGRMLTFSERMTLWRTAKRDHVRPSRQRGLSTEVAFTDPGARRRYLWTAPPDRGSALKNKPHRITPHLDGQAAASGRKNRAASRRRLPRSPAWHVQARPIAAELVKILPWLRSESLTRLLPMLKRFAVADEAWTAAQLVDAIDDHHARNSAGRPTRPIATYDPARIRTRPAIVLASLLRRLDVTDDWTPPAPTPCPCHHTDCRPAWIYPTDPTTGRQYARQIMAVRDDQGDVVECPHCTTDCVTSQDLAVDVIEPVPDNGGSYAEPPF